MARIYYRSGDVEVEMSDELERMFRSGPLACHQAIVDRLDSEADRLLAGARAAWPVGPERRGHTDSRVLLAGGLRVEGETISVFLSNSAPYARYIKARNLGGRSPVVELLRRPMARLGRQLIGGDLADLIARALTESTS